MIVLSTIQADVEGCIVLDVDYSKSDLDSAERRISRSPTLDGGAVIVDSGYCDGDRTLKIIARNVDETLAEAIRNMQQNNSKIHVAMHDGFYLAALSYRNFRDGGATLTVLLESKLS